LKEKGSQFDEIIVSTDLHQVFDIGHSCFWINSKGKHPESFTAISHGDFISGKWYCASKEDNKNVEIYLKSLSFRNKEHMIWPEHCVIGTNGSNIFEPVLTELNKWSKTNNKSINYITKGLFNLSEYHGIFGPAVEFPSFGKDAMFNFDLQRFILNFDNIVVTGEAKSHCVGESIEQLISGYGTEYQNDLCKKIKVLEDCMSNIVSFKHDIFDTLRENGTEFTLSTTLKLE